MLTQTDQIDMMAELFLDKQQEGHREFWIPPESEEECLARVACASTTGEREEALGKIVLIYRAKNISNDGKYALDTRQALIRILEQHGKECTADMLIREGAYCEKGHDFASAVDFYVVCVRAQKTDTKLIYFSYNNLGFSLNFLQKFSEAERYLREAIFICPKKYNAWKNLGVSLEWQGQYEEAAGAYLKAVHLTRGEPRSQLHLKRILNRHPSLRKIPCFSIDHKV